ncbi:class A beta-lactamase [Metabacillus sp. GX 13764]|uniref:class A beta-lactamase n=1 Tax=Metabacillus kandeliae TaxID=2900151 RepID=UPI001E462C95|nr:class A beta-lactamase [Metabacillus kandeliae]MCD7034116.1 class A beta-lactamase [Metabacillus kandeliae]
MRRWLNGLLCFVLIAALAGFTSFAKAQEKAPDPASKLAKLEKKYGARLGVYAINTGTGKEVSYKSDERFAYASTLKPLACGVLLQKNSLVAMDKVIHFSKDDLVTYSPITEKHTDTGMTLKEICDAALRYSDNTAANLLLKELGGPEEFKKSLRNIGDQVTEPERYETELNTAIPGDIRDTSTPRTFALDLKAFTTGKLLPPDKQAFLVDTMRRNTTGDKLIRAALPKGWTAGDKTGSGSYGTRNDIAIVWPPHKAPIVMAIFSSKDTEDAEYDDKLIADAAKIVLREAN